MNKCYCKWPDCKQRMEFGDELKGTKYKCPSCERETYLIPEISIPTQIIKSAESIGEYIICGYFDTDSVNPDNNSPYKFILSFYRIAYLTFAWLIIGLGILTLFNLHYSDDQSSDSNIYTFFLLHPKISKITIVLFLWSIGYWGYKTTRVIFDIAEYLRKISNK